jgi:hypothetical protein
VAFKPQGLCHDHRCADLLPADAAMQIAKLTAKVRASGKHDQVSSGDFAMVLIDIDI